jgi:hypothetical protein
MSEIIGQARKEGEKKDQIEIFLNKYAPITVIAQANPPITMKHRNGFI